MPKTPIEWADHSINCITGCSQCSLGCANCYAIQQSYRCDAMGIDKYEGVTERVISTSGKRTQWTGLIRTHPKVLEAPPLRKKPTRYFVNSMSDTFHPDVPFEFIDKILQMILNCPWHQFMILTKRPDRLIRYLDSARTRTLLVGQTKNLIIMTTVENQEWANTRVNQLMWIRSIIPGFPIGLSCEPLLGPINFNHIDHPCNVMSFMNWIIVGGESGRNARPMHPEWVRAIKVQCENKNIPFFFKQWGVWQPYENGVEFSFPDDPLFINCDGIGMYRLKGWKKQGRILDGKTYDELPDLMRDRS